MLVKAHNMLAQQAYLRRSRDVLTTTCTIVVIALCLPLLLGLIYITSSSSSRGSRDISCHVCHFKVCILQLLLGTCQCCLQQTDSA